MMKKSFFQSKKFKYGAVSHGITALVIILAVILNVLFSNLASRFRWYSDMTNSNLFTLSEEIKTMVSGVEAEVKIMFCADPDELMEDAEYLQYVFKTAENLAAEFDNIKIEYHDVVKEYNFFKKYAETTSSKIYTTSVIIESGTEFRLLQKEDFFLFTDETRTTAYAYNGEKKFAAAILQLTSSDTPLVLFTEQHGETLASDAATLKSLFIDAGFMVDTVNLASEEIPDNCRIVIINNPKYDFIGKNAEDESKNEIAKLDRFLDGLGALMVFADYKSSGDLVNLNEFLEEWGISFNHGTHLIDKEHSLSATGATILAEYEEKALGQSFYYDMINNLDSMPRTATKNSMPVNILWDEDPSESGNKFVVSALSSYDTAELLDLSGNVTEKGKQSLMTLSCDRIIVNNENSSQTDYIYSYVVACGSPSFVSNEYLTDNSLGNADIIYSAMRAVGREHLVADIEYKEFDNVKLTITTAQATRWTVGIAVIPPAIVAIAGIIVRIKRKNT